MRYISSSEKLPERIIPSVPGRYWCRSSKEFKWWDLVCEISGEAPWLQFNCIAQFSIIRECPKYPTDVWWGPMIAEPNPPEFYQ